MPESTSPWDEILLARLVAPVLLLCVALVVHVIACMVRAATALLLLP